MGEFMRKFASPQGRPGWAAALTTVKSDSSTLGLAGDLAQRFTQITGGSSTAGVADISELTRRNVVPIPDSMRMAGPGVGVATKMLGDQRAAAALPGAAESLKTIMAPPGAGALVDSLRRLKGLASVNLAAMQSLTRRAAPGAASLMTSTAILKELSTVRWAGGAPGAARTVGSALSMCRPGRVVAAVLVVAVVVGQVEERVQVGQDDFGACGPVAMQ